MKMKAILLATATVLAFPAAAAAQEGPTGSGNVAITTDYVWRGVSQTNENPAFQLGYDIASDMFYVGTWASNVDFGGDEQFEWDIYAGVKPTLGPVTFDFGVLGYLYPQDSNLNTWEVKAAGTVAAESGLAATVSLFYSPEVGNDGPSSLYSELAVSAPIPGATIGPFSLSVGASVGNYAFDNPGVDYTNWKVGITAATESGWAIEAAYTDTDLDGVETAEGRGILTLKRTF